MFDSLQEVEAEVPKRKKKSLLPEAKVRVIKWGKPIELYYCAEEAEGQKEYGFWKWGPSRTIKMQAT